MALTDNAVAFWDLDADVLDDSGNGKDGTNNGVTFSGGVAHFDGSSDIAIPSSLFSSDTYTYTGWFNASALASFQCNFAIYTSDTDSLELFVNSAGDGWGGSFGGGYLFGAGTFSTGTLYHVVLSSDGTNVKMYQNGSLLGTGTTFFSTFSVAGKIGSRNGSYKFQGTQQSVGLFSDAKDATWVASVYNSGTPLTWTGMSGGGGTTSHQLASLGVGQ